MIFSALCPGWCQTTVCSGWRGCHVGVRHTSPDLWESWDQRPSVLLWGSSPPQPISLWVSVTSPPSWIKVELVQSSSLTPLLPENNWPATTIWCFGGNQELATLLHLSVIWSLLFEVPHCFLFLWTHQTVSFHNCHPFPLSELGFNYWWYECGVQWMVVKIAVCDSLTLFVHHRLLCISVAQL